MAQSHWSLEKSISPLRWLNKLQKLRLDGSYKSTILLSKNVNSNHPIIRQMLFGVMVI